MKTQEILKTKSVSNAFKQLEETLKKRNYECIFFAHEWEICFKILEIKK